jgi:hypothetical protein
MNFREIYNAVMRRWAALGKVAGDIADVFKPKGYVELRLIYPDGPRKGEVARSVFVGRNVVTALLGGGGAAPTGGRDLIRRKLIPVGLTGITGSLADDDDATIQWCELGTDGTTESAADTGLGAAMSGTLKRVSEVDLSHGSSPYVTFVFDYDQTEANGTLRELVIWTNRTPKDPFARKTFGAFLNTSDFALQVRYTVRL